MTWLTTQLIKLHLLKISYADFGTDFTPPDASPQSFTIENPLGPGTTIESLINRIIDFLISLSIPLVTAIVVIGAFQIMLAGGNETKIANGRKTITYAAVGFAILLVAKGVTGLIEYALTGNTSGVTIDLISILTRVTGWLLGLMISLSVLMAVLAAWFFLTGSNEPKNIEKAKNLIKYTVISLVIGLGAGTISFLVQYFVNNSLAVTS